jgi:hypothetical protein
MCAPFCRDPRPQRPGVARRTADALDRAKVPPAAMTGYLAATFGVGRFAELCASHAEAVAAGVTKGILLDELRGQEGSPDG